MKKSIGSKKVKVRQLPLLVIEDNPDQWLIIRSALAQCFPEVEPIWANHAAQALTYLEDRSADSSQLPRLILLDLYLPSRQDGWALLEAIKANPQYQQVPIVALSASQEPEDVMRSYSLGVSSFLTKPTTYHQWLDRFYSFRRYWWETVVLPIPFRSTPS